jgi:hypothetical protein
MILITNCCLDLLAKYYTAVVIKSVALWSTRPDRKELIKIISARYLLISLITRKYLVDMILINLSGRGN